MSDPLGEESTQNVIPGSGDGAPGWIRVEPTIGGTPSCIPFRAETLLAGSLSQSETISLFVADPSIFPDDGGTVAVIAMMIDPETGLEREFVEVIEYESVDFNEDAVLWNLLDLTRAVNGEGPFDWSGGIGTDTRVVYVGSPVTPAGVLDGDGVEPSPEQIEENAGREGEMSFPFVLSVDPQTQLPVLDPESGQPLSIYTMNTNSGVILEPDGGIFRSLTRANAGDPNRLDVSRLFIDNGVVLSVRGDLPLEIFVAEVADIAGRIDVSGEDGGLLRFDRADLTSPIPGDGGRGGPGGGPGGRGGDMTFRDGDPLNKAPENTIPVAGGTGQLPPGAPPEWGAPLGGNAGDDELAPPLEITLAQPGVGLRGTGCGETANPFPCTGITAGGGGGGGNGTNASAGVSQPDGSGRGGEPAGPFGVQGFRFGGEVWPFGGTGGAGGGASPHISEPYANGEAGDALNQGQALYAPATGGGGGGGALRLVADQLFLRATGELRARGGNAFQSIDLGGNGGGGGGGSRTRILLWCLVLVFPSTKGTFGWSASLTRCC
jgi:hypothetical protein